MVANLSGGEIVLQVAVLILAISAHESAHAYVADLRGDSTARKRGRISFNPLVHVDLFGTILLPAFLIISGAPFLFGWAKPVPVNPQNLQNPRRDKAWVSLAGPAANFILALVGILIFALFFPFVKQVEGLPELITYNTVINSLLAVFNLLPVPPLDGGGIAEYLLPRKERRWLQQNRFVVFAIFIFLMMTGVLSQFLQFFLRIALSLQYGLAEIIWSIVF
ncbi:MAG: site-2 protease family protein [bacterium]